MTMKKEKNKLNRGQRKNTTYVIIGAIDPSRKQGYTK